jgi:hypothetical protein
MAGVEVTFGYASATVGPPAPVAGDRRLVELELHVTSEIISSDSARGQGCGSGWSLVAGRWSLVVD